MNSTNNLLLISTLALSFLRSLFVICSFARAARTVICSSFVRLLFVFCSSFVRHLFVFCSSFVRLLFVFCSSFVRLLFVSLFRYYTPSPWEKSPNRRVCDWERIFCSSFVHLLVQLAPAYVVRTVYPISFA